MRELSCPTCGREMKTFVRNEVEVDQCIQCGGIWLDGGELDRLVGVEPGEKRALKCPTCQVAMSLQLLRGVEVDFCPKCKGVYLDRGELEELTHPHQGEFRAWVDLNRNVEVAKDPVGKLDLETPLDNVFVMAKSGVLVASCAPKQNLALDEEVLAGMLMAIQDFVQTAFTSLAGAWLESINVGDRRLLLERGDFVVIAAVVAGEKEVVEDYRNRMKEGIADIEKEYAPDLERWDGDLDKLKGLREEIARVFV